MSTYDALASTVDDIVTQAILAEMRLATKFPNNWLADDQENPTRVTYTFAARPALGCQVEFDWSTGAVIRTSHDNGVTPPLDPSGTFLAWKSKWETAIPPLFDKYLGMPYPEHFARESSDLDLTGTTLNGGGFKIGDTRFEGTNLDYHLWQVGSERGKMLGWSGAAATAFRDKYLKTWPANLSNQFAALAMLKGNIEREKAMWTKAREQIALTADHAVSAMKGADGPEPDDKVALAIFAAAAGVVGVAIPVAGQVALAAAVGSLAVADSMKGEKKQAKEMSFGAETPDAVFSKLDAGLTTFENEIWDAEHAIHTDLKALQDKLHVRTAFIGTGADALLGSTDPYDVGVRGDQFEVSEIKDLRSFAQTCIDAAGDARTASSACAINSPSATRNRVAGLGYGYTGAADQYANCVTMLQDIIGDNGIIIGDAGVQLDAAANAYSDADQDSENKMRNHSAELVDMRKDDGSMPAPPPPPPVHRGPGHEVPV
ncbi:hypothetical protein [Nocardioides sp. Root151]|uniref:hypothetical protein n=1 Tax=Nocardioides sp. Root151 TaxID=1736475 RepID=UPI000702871D|nr:hypothetical protein [Nocardioides sp. Root151]KQZ76138.1 hypothetical protein ASD66_07650 [Nocardioides sp. Root151]